MRASVNGNAILPVNSYACKGVLLSVCTVGHRGPVWFWILVLSVLCRFEWVCSALETKEVQECLDNLSKSIQNSTAQLYAPSVDEIKEKCELPSLICYMLELKVVFLEEEDLEKHEQDNIDCVAAFSETLQNIAITELNTGPCPPCEATAPRSITTFLDNLKSLMQKLNSLAP
uniref:Interleukin n=1 Tax=Knipowitschia caucasica TaxID=637954 RepID=A0AAV2LIX7_KNICA